MKSSHCVTPTLFLVQMELETASTDSEAAANELEEDGEESDDEDDEDSDKEEDDENGNSNSAAEKINQILRPNAENAILVSETILAALSLFLSLPLSSSLFLSLPLSSLPLSSSSLYLCPTFLSLFSLSFLFYFPSSFSPSPPSLFLSFIFVSFLSFPSFSLTLPLFLCSSLLPVLIVSSPPPSLSLLHSFFTLRHFQNN